MPDSSACNGDPRTVNLAGVDLTDPAWFAAGPPHELFARMRAEAPVRWNASTHAPEFWSLTKAADITAVSKDHETFSSHRGGIWFREDATAPLEVARNLLIFKDPPEHTKYRAILQTAFTPRTVAQLESAVRERVIAALEVASERGSLDVVSELAIPIPIAVIADLLGAPQEDRDRMLDWTTRLDRAVDQPSEDGMAVLGEMAEYFTQLVAEQRDDADTLVNALARAEVDGQRLTDAEIMLFFGILVFAGNDTTRNATSGGVKALVEHPDQLSALREDPSLIPDAVEEVLRWSTPLNYFARTATRDTSIRDVPIRAGDKLVMWYASGSRDEDAFAGADRFDVRRRQGSHQAFGGGGRHFCLGAGLARLELRVIFEELARRVTEPQLAGPVQHASSAWVNGLASLPIAFTPARA